MSPQNKLLKTSHLELSQEDILSQPIDALLGVSTNIADILSKFNIKTIFDLASSRLFNNALFLLNSYEKAGSTIDKTGLIPIDIVEESHRDVPLGELIESDIVLLDGIDDTLGKDIKHLLHLETIREFALWFPFTAASQILKQVLSLPINDEEDIESPSELVPKMGDFPTEKAFYSVLVLDEIQNKEHSTLNDIDQPIDITKLNERSSGFQKLAFGAVITYEQLWFAQGISLGNLLHSVPLAPGESTKIAMINWARLDSSSLTEEISVEERLENITNQARSISEVTNAVATEAQDGFSRATNKNYASSSARSNTKSKTGAGGGGFGIAGPGFVIGGAGGYSATSVTASVSNQASSFAEAVSVSASSGRRDLAASMAQNISNSTQQIANSLRSQRASIVAETMQTENETLTTRVITNYNHMHALSIHYYEVVQTFKVITSVSQVEKLVFVPLKIITEWNEKLIKQFRQILTYYALTPGIQNTLISNPNSIVLTPSSKAENLQELFPKKSGGSHPSEISQEFEFDIIQLAENHFFRANLQTGQLLADDIQGPFIIPNRGQRINHLSFSELSNVTDDNGSLKRSWNKITLNKVNGDKLEISQSMLSAVTGETTAFHRNKILNGIGNYGENALHVIVNLFWEKTERLEDIHSITIDYEGAAIEPGTPLWLRIGFKKDGFEPNFQTVEPFKPFIINEESLDDFFVVIFITSEKTNTKTLENGSIRVTMFSTEQTLGNREFFEHFSDNAFHYSQAIWDNIDNTILAQLMSSYKLLDKPLAERVDATPLGRYANYLIFRMNVEKVDEHNTNKEWEKWEAWKKARGFDEQNVTQQEIVPIPSGGVFAEAVLGRFNSAEKLDLTRFWNWQDSPIPFTAPEIASINSGSRFQNVQVEPGELSQPLVNIVNPQPLPDPTGMSSIINALTASNMFRDMSGLEQTVALAQNGLQSAFNAATAAGEQAQANAYMATMANLEAFKSTLSTAQGFAGLVGGQGAPGKSNISTAGAAINQAQKIDSKKSSQNLPNGNNVNGSNATGQGSTNPTIPTAPNKGVSYASASSPYSDYSSAEERTLDQIMGGARPILASAPSNWLQDSGGRLDSGQTVTMPQFFINKQVGKNIVKDALIDNEPEDVLRVQERLTELGFNKITIGEDTHPTDDMIRGIVLFQAITSGYASFMNDSGKYLNRKRVDGIVDPNGRAERWLQAENAPRWVDVKDHFPQNGIRFLPSSTNSGKDHYCTSWLKDTLIAAGIDYQASISELSNTPPPISVHEFSPEQGGYNSPHRGHQTGMMCDVRLPRLDRKGQNGVGNIKYTHPQYDKELTRKILISLGKQDLVKFIKFNDASLIKEVNNSLGKNVCSTDGTDKDGNQITIHDNHIHVRIRVPEQGKIIEEEIVLPSGTRFV